MNNFSTPIWQALLITVIAGMILPFLYCFLCSNYMSLFESRGTRRWQNIVILLMAK